MRLLANDRAFSLLRDRRGAGARLPNADIDAGQLGSSVTPAELHAFAAAIRAVEGDELRRLATSQFAVK